MLLVSERGFQGECESDKGGDDGKKWNKPTSEV